MRQWQEKSVNITLIKEFALDRLPKGSNLRELILSEKERLEVPEFVSLMKTWSRLLNLELAERRPKK